MPHEPPEPAELQRRFEESRALDWGSDSSSAAELTELYGEVPARRSLELLAWAAVVEPAITEQFIAALPATAAPYDLQRRVKSPRSLARKLSLMEESDRQRPVADVLRYTLLTETPDDLVQAARDATNALVAEQYKVTFAMQSYADGSRYKGIHAILRPPDFPRIEVQFHSVPSAQVKALTTPWYAIERDPRQDDARRDEARQRCVEVSAQLRPPADLDALTTLGGRQVIAGNYRFSGTATPSPHETRDNQTKPDRRNAPGTERNDEITR